ncbi:MAG: rod shape-determining protein MreD [Sphingobacteriales bacterium]|nr:rod shape-determining protein MreD [Sphingobacteriales bacterium]
MNSEIAKNIIRFVALIGIQIFLLNRIELHGYITPFIYPLFVLLLPFQMPVSAVLLLGFLSGLTIDLSIDTLGIHAAATTLMAFVRSFIIEVIEPRLGYDNNDKPTWACMGYRWFLIYAGVAVLFHQTAYYLIEALSFEYFHLMALKILASSAVALLLMSFHQILFYKKVLR